MKQAFGSGSNKPSSQKRTVILLLASLGAIVLLAILGVAAFFLIGAGKRSAQIARFDGRLKDYLAIPKDSIEKDGYLRGKVVAINMRDKVIDDQVFFQLPTELRANGPEEVGSVVLLRWGSTTADKLLLRNGSVVGSLSFATCDVQIVDPSVPAVVGRCYFVGKTEAMDVDRVRPIKEIIDYLTHLPRETPGTEPAPQGWTVLFRSADPKVWNTDSPGEEFAVPVRRAHKAVRFLRLKRLDTSEFVIIPITHNQLKEEAPPNPAEGFWWNGTARPNGGHNPVVRFLGVVQNPPSFADRKKAIQVGSASGSWYTGFGFGEKLGQEMQQAYCWNGKEVPKTIFEVAVTAAGLTEAEKRWLAGLDAEEGPPPRGWTVLFRADDPLVWNTFGTAAAFAVPVNQAHSQVRHLRLKRTDTGEAVIVPISRAQLLRQPNPLPQTGFGWNGKARNEWGGVHLGIFQAPAIDWREAIAVLSDGRAWCTGWGFGHKIGVDDRQYQVWQGKEIPATVFEVAVSADPLTEEEKRLLPVPQRFYKPLPKVPPGTLVARALPQPEPPPAPPGKTVIDLIPLMDQTKDVVYGRWLIAKNVLHCNDQSDVPRMQVPYQPPEEYDFSVTFSQPSPRNGISLIMPSPRGGSFFWLLGYHGGVDYQLHGTPNREGSFRDGLLPKPMPANKVYTTTVQVRRDGVKAFLDGKLLLEHKTDFRDLGSDGYRQLPNPNLLGVACDDPTVFHYIQVVEITGSGTKLR